MNNNREEMLNNFVLAIISIQNEIKDAVKTVSAQVAEIKDDIKLKKGFLRCSKRILSCENNLRAFLLTQSVQHPVAEGAKNKCQLSWGLLRRLMEDVHSSLVDNVMFDAARNHITIFRLPALICEVKDKHQIENGKSFKDTDPQTKLAAIEALHNMQKHIFSYKGLLHVLLRYNSQ
ncbi:hypothetical protein RMATCC62417_02881 [Rhizopus microsporus]|nr:hypothetical protein RMATCC62417_02881 [Rhizopus microsporus]